MCRDAMSQLGVRRDCRYDVALAVSEACANVVVHAAGGTEEYEVRIEFTGEWCHIRVIDTGAGFDATRLDTGMPQSTGEPHCTGEDGRGIALMHLLVDQIQFDSRPEEGTVVHLQKLLDLEDGSPLQVLTLPPALAEKPLRR
jgi:serine/threonine-protein kinase RsbW